LRSKNDDEEAAALQPNQHFVTDFAIADALLRFDVISTSRTVAVPSRMTRFGTAQRLIDAAVIRKLYDVA